MLVEPWQKYPAWEIQPETLKSAASYVFQKNEEASALWNDEESLSHVSSHALLCCVELEADRWSVESCANMNFILWDYLHSDNTQKKSESRQLKYKKNCMIRMHCHYKVPLSLSIMNNHILCLWFSTFFCGEREVEYKIYESYGSCCDSLRWIKVHYSFYKCSRLFFFVSKWDTSSDSPPRC